MHPAFCILIQSQPKFKFILSDNHANILRNKVARAKDLEFIDHPSYVLVKRKTVSKLTRFNEIGSENTSFDCQIYPVP